MNIDSRILVYLRRRADIGSILINLELPEKQRRMLEYETRRQTIHLGTV